MNKFSAQQSSKAQSKSLSLNRSLLLEVIIFVIVVALIFGFTYFKKNANHSPEAPASLINSLNLYSLNEPVNILVAGTDQEYKVAKDGYSYKTKNKFRGRTDTIVVFRFDPIQKRLSALNIPRDTKIYLQGQHAAKINSVNTEEGPEYLKEVLESLLDIKIDHYILVNTNGIHQIIDEAGGIEIEVEKAMKYSDKTDGLNIDLQPGKQRLNGKECIGFLRFRQDTLGDIGRIQRQQQFIRAAKRKLADPYLLAKLPILIQIGFQNIQTDLGISQILQFANFMRGIPDEKHTFATLPGDFSVPETQTKVVYEETPDSPDTSSDSNNPEKVSVSNNPYTETASPNGETSSTHTHLTEKIITVHSPFVSYWLANEAEVKKLVDRLFKYDYIFDASASNQESQIKVAIENTSHNPQASRQLSKLLTESGFQVIDVSNSKRALPSAIYAQKGNIEDAKLIRARLNLKRDTKLIASSMGFPLSDITIILGDKLAEEIMSKKQAESKNKNSEF